MFYKKLKVGLDSGVLIDLIDNPEMSYYQFLRIFKRKNIIFTSLRCIDEVIGVLINRKNYSPEQANQILDQFLIKHNIRKIKRICNIQNIKNIEKMAEEKGIKTNEEDLPIIADFNKFGINKIFTKDENFAKLCRAIGLTSEKMHIVEKEISRQFYQLFRDKYKKFKKKL